MSCKEIQDKILRFIDNDIKDKELEDFLKHINECQPCKEELEIYYSLLNGCKQLNSDLEVPDDFHESLMDKIRTNERTIKKQKQKVAIRRYAGAVAAVFALIVAIQGFTLLGDIGKKEDNTNMARIAENAEQAKSEERTEEDGIFDIPVKEPTSAEVEINSFTSDQVKNDEVQYEASTNVPNTSTSNNQTDDNSTGGGTSSSDPYIGTTSSDNQTNNEKPTTNYDMAKANEPTSDSAKKTETIENKNVRNNSLSDEAESTYTEEKSNLGFYLGAFMITASILFGAIFFLKVRK